MIQVSEFPMDTPAGAQAMAPAMDTHNTRMVVVLVAFHKGLY